jgi:glycosyltransferase involved in cell wall biosynthesis
MSVAVTCIVPVHNGERYLTETLRSILAQTHRPLELIVVDNASTDASGAIARSFGDAITVIRQEDRGPTTGRNLGITAARGDYLAFCDADDLFEPQKLARQVAHFAGRPDLDISLCTAESFWEPGLEDERARYEASGRTRATHALGTMLARRSVFERIGLLDPELVHGDHIEWFMRVVDAQLAVGILPEVLMRRRMHTESWSHRMSNLDPYFDLLRKRMRGRRAS